MSDPTNVKFATFPQRLLAFNIDMTIFLLTVVPLFVFIENDRLFAALLFTVVCLYHALFESSFWQGTLGKKYTRLKVIDQHGNKLTFLRALLRIITKYLSLLLFFAGFFMIYFRRDRRGLHDVLAKTYVVDRGNLYTSLGKTHK